MIQKLTITGVTVFDLVKVRTESMPPGIREPSSEFSFGTLLGGESQEEEGEVSCRRRRRMGSVIKVTHSGSRWCQHLCCNPGPRVCLCGVGLWVHILQH